MYSNRSIHFFGQCKKRIYYTFTGHTAIDEEHIVDFNSDIRKSEEYIVLIDLLW